MKDLYTSGEEKTKLIITGTLDLTENAFRHSAIGAQIMTTIVENATSEYIYIYIYVYYLQKNALT